MKLVWDVTEWQRFADNLQETYELETALMTATQKIARVLHAHLLNLTPVDTGNLRKMWSAGDNLAFTVEPVENGYSVTLVNEAYNDRSGNMFMYSIAVNDGHRTPSGTGWVVGRFFVENSILQTAGTGEVEKVIMEQLQNWWRGV